jgi:hypothetical protein
VRLGKNYFWRSHIKRPGDANSKGADLIVHERLVLAIHVENVCVCDFVSFHIVGC